MKYLEINSNIAHGTIEKHGTIQAIFQNQEGETPFWFIENVTFGDDGGGDYYSTPKIEYVVAVYSSLNDVSAFAAMKTICDEYGINYDEITIEHELHYVNVHDEEKFIEKAFEAIGESDVDIVELAEKATNNFNLNTSSHTDGFTRNMWEIIFEREDYCEDHYDGDFESALVEAFGNRKNAIIEIVKQGIEEHGMFL